MPPINHPSWKDVSPVLELVPAPTDETIALVGELEAELSGDYSADQRHGYNIARLFQPHVLFFIARLDSEAVGCGGIAFEDGFAELKRMYVRPRWRGHGIGRTILDRLENEAHARGVTRLVLETGDVLHRAIRLYEGAGFRRCGTFGAYSEMAPQAVERSVFMEKPIGRPRTDDATAGRDA